MFGWFNKTKVAEKKLPETLVGYQGWRNSMWVHTPDGVGIVFKLDTVCEIHLTDDKGLTILAKEYPILALRQATYLEIPKARRGFSKEVALSKGYK